MKLFIALVALSLITILLLSENILGQSSSAFVLKCDKDVVKLNETVKCSVQNCAEGLWFVRNKENTPLNASEEVNKDIPPEEIEIKPTGTEGVINVYVACFAPTGPGEPAQEKQITVSMSGSTSTTILPSSSDELICGFDKTLVCKGGEKPHQEEVLIDNFDDNKERWEENMMFGNVMNGEYTGQITSTTNPSMSKVVDVNKTLNHISMKYKSYPGGPNAIKIYYVDGNSCLDFDDACSQTFPVVVTSEYQLLALDITDTEWINSDGKITKLKMKFEGVTDTGSIFLDSIKITPAGFIPAKKDVGVSIRSGNRLTYPVLGNIATDKGTINFWIKPFWNGNDNNVRYFIDVGNATDSNRISVYKNSDNKMVFNILDTAGNNNQASRDISNWKADEIHNVWVTWKVNEMNLYVDSILAGIDLSVNTPLTLGDKIFIGSDMNKNNQAGAVLDEMIITSNIVTPVTTTTTTTTIPKKELGIKDVTCDQDKCNLEISKNTIGSNLTVYVNIIHEPEGIIYYKGNANIDMNSVGNKTIGVNSVRVCPVGLTLMAITAVYRTDNLKDRIDRVKSVAFEC